MTKCGIGPKFFSAAVLYGLFAGGLKHQYPEQCLIQCVPYLILACIGGVLIAVGIAVYIMALRTFNAGYRKGLLVTEGAFSVVRHPIYAAWILCIIPGFAMVFHSWPMLLVPLVAYVGFRLLISQEEEVLKQKFGDKYLNYKSRTREFFPCRKKMIDALVKKVRYERLLLPT